MSDVRGSYAYQKARAAFFASARAADERCWVCGGRVWWDAPPNHKAQPTVDHLVETDRRPDVALDVELWRLAHRSCNSSRGNRYERGKRRRPPETPDPTYRPSREW